ncbi:hypothetical protein DE4576_05456 [Mycobacterium marinum]|nr:hypothetical protein DE4576_05456 [Mycobacterium marinum]
MQVPRGIDFGPQHRVDTFGGQRGNHRVIKHTTGVDHGGQRPLRGNFGDHLGQRRTVGRVTGHHLDLCSGSAQLGYQLGSPRCGGAPPADEHQMGHAVVGHQVPRERRTRHAGSTGDQYRSATQRTTLVGRHGHHDLADVAGLAQVAQRRRRAPHVEGCDRQWPQHAGVEQPGQVEHVLVHARATGFEQVECAIAHTRIFLGDDAGVTDVGLAHLQEHPARAQQAQRSIHEFAGQRVQHHIDATAAGDLAEFLLEFQAARIRDVVFVKAHGPQDVPFALAGGGVHLQTQVPGQLHGCHAHPAGGGVDQYPLAWLDIGQVHERVVSGGENG